MIEKTSRRVARVEDDTWRIYVPSLQSGTMIYSLTPLLAPCSKVSDCRFILYWNQRTLLTSGKVHAGKIEPWTKSAQTEFTSTSRRDLHDVVVAVDS